MEENEIQFILHTLSDTNDPSDTIDSVTSNTSDSDTSNTSDSDTSDASKTKKRKRTPEESKKAHREVERRRTTRISNTIQAIGKTIRCEKKDKASILEAALLVLQQRPLI